MIKVLVADDHKMIREGLQQMLRQEPGIEVSGEAEDGYAAVRMASELSPDVVIMDITMPNLNGIEASRRIVSQDSKTKVIALSMHSDPRFVVEALQAGASGYLLKDAAFEDLAFAIRTVMSNRSYLSPSITGPVIDEFVNHAAGGSRSPSSLLSPREREVLQLLAEGKSSREIAALLCVSIKTAETHRAKIMAKLDIHSIAALTKYAVRHGLASLEA